MDLRELILSQLQMSAGGMQSAVSEGITEEEAVARPDNLAPIVWQVGHIAYYEALLVAEVTDSEPDVPEVYGELFKQGSSGGGEFPPLAEVVETLKRSQAAVQRLADGDLNKPLAGEPLYATVGGALLFTHYHRGYHLGKIMTLRGLLGKEPVI